MFFKKKKSSIETPVEKKEKNSYWNTNTDYMMRHSASERLVATIGNIVAQHNQLKIQAIGGNAMDSADLADGVKMTSFPPTSINTALADWFGSHSFIGHQMCALLAQHWLIKKACHVPARDATRNGYNIVATNGDEIPTEIIKTLEKYDKKYRIKYQAEQFLTMGRIFGIRLAFFDIASNDPDFYEKPFNLDGVEKGSYKGVVQVDPYWCVPELVGSELADPTSAHFYEPTYWRINNKRIHRSHLFIFRNGDVPDLVKPMYLYGGVPVPQLIMERVYGAERTASEALSLVTSKRTSIWLTNMEAFAANASESAERLLEWIYNRDNHGIKLGDKEQDQFQQFDTALGDLDEVIMTQYQLVAAAVNVPATKLLGTSPKGFNSTGEAEAKSYHEELESIQEHDLTEFIERHHQLVIKAFCDEHIETSISWRPVDSPTAKELAELNNLKAQSYGALVMAGAIDGDDVRFRLVNDPDSGFHDMGENKDDLEELGLTPEDIVALKVTGENDEKSKSIQQH